jgi:hypothetical protein
MRRLLPSRASSSPPIRQPRAQSVVPFPAARPKQVNRFDPSSRREHEMVMRTALGMAMGPIPRSPAFFLAANPSFFLAAAALVRSAVPGGCSSALVRTAQCAPCLPRCRPPTSSEGRRSRALGVQPSSSIHSSSATRLPGSISAATPVLLASCSSAGPGPCCSVAHLLLGCSDSISRYLGEQRLLLVDP